MKTRRELKRQAKEVIGVQRGTAILLLLVFVLKVLALCVICGILLRWLGKLGWLPAGLVYWAALLALLVLAVGVTGEYIKIYRGASTRVMALYTDFKTRFGRKLGGMLWMLLWLFLWALISLPIVFLAIFLMRRTGRGMKLLVLVLMGPVHLAALIPAIIKGLSYFMTPYILADCPDVTARGALRLSKEMMRGRKRELFVMMLSFIGWMFLSVLTLGVLYIVYVGPYMYTTYAGLYAEARGETPVEEEAVVIEVEAEPEAEIVLEAEIEAE